jgi:hypothetical protein
MRRLLLAAILTAVLAGPGRASSVVDGRFETDPTDWTGSVQVVESLTLDPVAGGFSVTGPTEWEATEGQHFGLLSANPTQGERQAWTTVEAQAGDVLAFDWFWVTGNPGGTDRVRALLVTGGVEDEVFTSFAYDLPGQTAEVYASDWMPHVHTFAAGGSYELHFAVLSEGETPLVETYLGVDNARIVPAEVIPEPVTFAALAGSLVSLGAYLRRRDRAQGRN